MTEHWTVGVTGAAGYLGSRLTADLLAAGHEVVAIDNFHAPKVDAIDGVTIRDVDVRDRAAIREALGETDAICHLAAISGVQECDADPDLAFDTNVGGTATLAWCCREWGTPLVFPCSMAVIGDPVEFPITAAHPRAPLNLYGRLKAMGEDDIHHLAADGFPAHVFLKTNLYGAHEIGGRSIDKHTVINLFVEKALNREPLTVHEPGTQARDFLHVKDAARAYRLSIEALLGADDGAVTIPLPGGDSRSVIAIAETVQSTVEDERGYRPPIELVENPRSDETEAEEFTVDPEPAETRIGFTAKWTVEEAIREMIT